MYAGEHVRNCSRLKEGIEGGREPEGVDTNSLRILPFGRNSTTNSDALVNGVVGGGTFTTTWASSKQGPLPQPGQAMVSNYRDGSVQHKSSAGRGTK